MSGGLVHRYRTTGIDGLAGDENPFFACSLWRVEQYARSGRVADARALLDRVCALAGDVGLLAEEQRRQRAPARRQHPAGALASRARAGGRRRPRRRRLSAEEQRRRTRCVRVGMAPSPTMGG